jgi:hypothetical protein
MALGQPKQEKGKKWWDRACLELKSTPKVKEIVVALQIKTNQQTNTTIRKPTQQTRRVSDCGLAFYIKKYLKAKEELWKLKYFTTQKSNVQKIL